MTYARVPEPLPAFSFPQAPGPSSNAPASPLLAPQRPDGHRRGPSEQVANNVKPHSPTQAEGGSPPSLPAPGPGLSAAGPRRRGHAHRRSAAISSVDLTAIAKAFPPMPLGGSAPTTPADIKQQHVRDEDVTRPTSRSFPNLSPHVSPMSSPDQSWERREHMSHLRPGASEASSSYLRRPLSTISSEGNHSVATSTASFSAGSFPTQQTTARPKTAGPSLDFTSQGAGKSDVENDFEKRPLSASATTFVNQIPDTIPIIKCTQDEPISGNGAGSSNANCYLETPNSSTPNTKNGPSRKSSKKQKNVRSWAGILTRKAKRRSSKKSKRGAPSTPQVSSQPESEVASILDVDFDEDNTIVIRTPTALEAPRLSVPSVPSDSSTNGLTLETSWKPRSFYEQGRDSDMFSPVIDLDAALGPFNTPEMGCDRPAGSGFSAATKRMYSGGRRGEFVGPEMRYHRRTESAPEMPPIDRSAFGLSRLGGTTSLANPDVFYEEEEDAFLAGGDPAKPESQTSKLAEKSKQLETRKSVDMGSMETVKAVPQKNSAAEPEAPGLGIKVVDSADPRDFGDMSQPESVVSTPGLDPSANEPATPDSAALDLCDHAQSTAGSEGNIEIVDTDNLALRPEEVTQPAPKFVQIDRRPATSPDLVSSMTKPFAPPDMPSMNSVFPSPDLSASSFDPPRLTTASSSMTDRHTFHSAYSLEHGSTEDVPSLTSSASTMTGATPRMSSSFYSRTQGERSGSVCTTGSRRASRSNPGKRSSLVSLSKLMSGSTGEKSKLSYEEKAAYDDTEKEKEKKRRSTKISRLIHFWKSKEKGSNKA
ncbi:hypothetical protein AJ80_06124 [Polytolypa hystricis UAMH7299]|uniref:Cell wall proline rich protein n=1 Tax=Polytolypa hystricis (strain UAMH7299) TaxID=1447883 RepID=A0A2B7XQD4_POLH7|nr:hypothetical protein AJ80_06124 [Polytolypa hystricis UAMH7299]